VGPGTHPWMDVPSETTAEVDMLAAARAFRPRTVGHDVYVTGFSQGASAGLGLAEELQSSHGYFRLAALAPISGAYDFHGAEIPAMLSGQLIEKLSVAYVSYLFVAWNRLHHLYANPAEVFRKPYANRVTALFDGNTPGDVMLASLPDTIDELLTPAGLRMLTASRGRMADAMRVADDVCDWHPQVPMELLFSPGDGEAANANTTVCQADLSRQGLAVSTVDLGDDTDYNGFIHEGSEILGVAATARWFRQLAR
ncbi:MAG TPA: lipase, partial [Micromonosporaceae bacterium]